MGRRRRRTRIVEHLPIEKIAAEGKGLGRDENGKIIFVDYALPGDVVNAFVYKTKKDVGIARINGLQEASPLRIEPFCEHFGVCGGCKWQHASYEDQLQFKHSIVKEAFERIGKVAFPDLPPVLGSPKTREYRNKLEFTFSNNQWLTAAQIESGEDFDKEHALGFHVPKFFDKIVDIEHCYLQEEPSNAIRLAVKEFAVAQGYEFFDLRKMEGFLRNLIIRNSSLGELMVILCVFEPRMQQIEEIMKFLHENFPQITSLNYIINEKLNDSIFDQDVICYAGKDHLLEQLNHCKFKIGPKSFFQTNSYQAGNLYDITLEFTELTGNEVVYDLFTGTGSIANYIAKRAKHVVGVELIPEAIEDAKENAILNENDNCAFVAGKVEDLFTPELLKQHGKPDVVILDPPRAGIHKHVVEQLLRLGTERIVYVSCNPATQARDVALLNHEYKITKIQPVDLFPHTHHIENVIQLTKR